MIEEGDEISGYSLKQFLGRGSYGEVWLADRKIELADECIPFALKFLTNQSGKGIDSEGVKSEIRTWIKAGNNFNIVPVYDGFIHGRFLVIVSEYIEGGSLREWLSSNGNKAPSLEKAVEMMRGILRGLRHLHSRKIIHRDLKPENILIKDGAPKITDFGLSRVVETLSQSNTLRFTKGAGTPLYMPPEAFSVGNPTPQLDTWSAGVMFYEMLSGEFPFNAVSIAILLGEITNREPKPLPSSVPEELQQIVSVSLTKDVSRRFQTAGEMEEALEKAWAKLEQHRQWHLGTIVDDVPPREDGQQTNAVGEEPYNQQDEEQKGDIGVARRHRDAEYDNNQHMVIPELREESTDGSEQEKPDKTQSGKAGWKGFKKPAWIGIALVALGLIIGGVYGFSIRRQSRQTGDSNRAKECYEKKDYDCAIENYTKVIELTPQSADVYFNRGRAYIKKDNPDRAISDYSKAIELNPQMFEAHSYRGAAYGIKGDTDQAIKDFNRAIELNPQYGDAYFNRAVAYKDKREYDQAVIDFSKAIELNPQKADAYTYRGETYSLIGSRDQAIKDFNKALELSPKDAEVYNKRGAAYFFEGNLDQAIKDLDEAIELKPQQGDAYYYRGLAYGNRGNNDQAMRDFSKAIELNPQMAEAYAFRGSAYANKGNFDQAVRDFNKAIELNPKLEVAYLNRGLAYGNRGDHEQAMKDFSKAIELNPQYGQAYYYRSFAYRSLGRTAQAQADLQRSKDLPAK